MKIGILLYSYTGNTLSIAQKIKEQLGDIPIERVALVNGDPNGGQPLKLKDVPNIEQYDKLIIGAPINAFNLCKAMKLYFQTSPKFSAKEVNIFVTQHFKKPFLGGNKGVKQISDYCKSQGAEVKNTAIVHWSAKDRDEQIENAVKLMAEI